MTRFINDISHHGPQEGFELSEPFVRPWVYFWISKKKIKQLQQTAADCVPLVRGT